MGSGCLWSFLPILILIPLYTVVRQPITYMLQQSAEVADAIVAAIKGVAPDMFTAQGEFYNQMIAAPQIPNFLAEIKAAKKAAKNKPSREERGYTKPRGRKDDWMQFFMQDNNLKGEAPNFNEEGWAKKNKKK